MSQENKIDKFSLIMHEDTHLGENGDICFYKGKLLSVADDNTLKVYNIENDSSKNGY